MEEQVRRVSEKLRGQYATAIVDKEPKTISELRDVCRRVEAAADLKRAASDFKQLSFKQSTTQPRQNVTPRNDKEKPSCSRCWRNNHSIADCAAKTHFDGRSKMSPLVSKKSVKTLAVFEDDDLLESEEARHPDENESEEEDNDDVQVECLMVNHQAIAKPTITISCNGIDVVAVIDTGAARTVVSEHLTKENDWVIKPCRLPMSVADNKLFVVGTCKLPLKIVIDNIAKTKTHQVVVVRSLATQMLLGADLIAIFKINIDLAANSFTFSDTAPTRITLPGSNEDVAVGRDLSNAQYNQIIEIVKEHAKAFSLAGELGLSRRGEHKIDIVP